MFLSFLVSILQSLVKSSSKYFFELSQFALKRKLSIYPKDSGLLITNNTGNSGNLNTIRVQGYEPTNINFSIPNGNDEKKNLLEYVFLLDKLCTNEKLRSIVMLQDYNNLKKTEFNISINNKEVKISFDGLLITEKALIDYKLKYLKELAGGKELHELINCVGRYGLNLENTILSGRQSGRHHSRFFKEKQINFKITSRCQDSGSAYRRYDNFLNGNFFKEVGEEEKPYLETLTFENLRNFFKENITNFQSDVYYLLCTDYFLKDDSVEHISPNKDVYGKKKTVPRKFYKKYILVLCVVLFPELIREFDSLCNLNQLILYNIEYFSLPEGFLFSVYEVFYPEMYEQYKQWKKSPKVLHV